MHNCCQMSDLKNNVLHRWFEEVWNQGSEEAIDKLAAADVLAHGILDATGNEIQGREAFKAFWRQFRAAFPDLRVEVQDGMIDGDKVMVRCTVRGTHKGEGIGLPPTLKPVTFTGICAARIKDGRIVEAWNNFDFLSFYQQLGLVASSFR